MTRMLRHHRLDLALHELRPGEGRTLLLLHGLGQRTPDRLPPAVDGWPGPVYGLDFSGHGGSGRAVGGGYTSGSLLGDVDVALADLGPAALYGWGLGGWVALLAAGSRPELVAGALIGDGPGLAGGGPAPSTLWVGEPVLPPPPPAPDPLALAELARDVRPPAYAVSFAAQALAHAELENPLVVVARFLPPWLAAVAELPGVVRLELDEGLALLAKAGA